MPTTTSMVGVGPLPLLREMRLEPYGPGVNDALSVGAVSQNRLAEKRQRD